MSIFRCMAIPVWQDGQQGQADNYLTLQDQTPPALGQVATVLSTMQTISACSCLGAHITRWATVHTTGGPSNYPTVRDKAQFTFRTANGLIAKITVPGPVDEILMADHQTVDLANDQVRAFIDACTAALASASGEALILCTGAYRQKIRLLPQAW